MAKTKTTRRKSAAKGPRPRWVHLTVLAPEPWNSAADVRAFLSEEMSEWLYLIETLRGMSVAVPECVANDLGFISLEAANMLEDEIPRRFEMEPCGLNLTALVACAEAFREAAGPTFDPKNEEGIGLMGPLPGAFGLLGVAIVRAAKTYHKELDSLYGRVMDERGEREPAPRPMGKAERLEHGFLSNVLNGLPGRVSGDVFRQLGTVDPAALATFLREQASNEVAA